MSENVHSLWLSVCICWGGRGCCNQSFWIFPGAVFILAKIENTEKEEMAAKINVFS